MSASEIELITPKVLKGFRDIFPDDLTPRRRMIDRIIEVYERYGFSPLETPALEYVDVLGKYLPESETPEGGIFAFREEEEWVALRYDLTAPLSRVVALYNELPRPFRRYQIGPVWRKEKPGPGRFREFYQVDFDSVGVPGMIADAEACSIAADCLEAVGIERNDYIVRINNRKILNGVLETAGIVKQTGTGEPPVEAMNVLRSIDKLDRIGRDGIRELLGKGRLDESGDFTRGANLDDEKIRVIDEYLDLISENRSELCNSLEKMMKDSQIGIEGVEELREIDEILAASGYAEDRVIFDPTVVRGLGYYTGPVFEAELTIEITDEKGERRRFGSVFGGGRYDDLVKRFTGENVPATGASIGIDRLTAALKAGGKIKTEQTPAPVLVTVMDKDKIAEYNAMATELRNAGINTELYAGNRGFRAQLKYADKVEKTVVIIVGEDERLQKTAAIKDLKKGRMLSKKIKDRSTWLEEQPAQITVERSNLVSAVKEMLARYED